MLGVNTVKIRSKPCLNHVYTLTTVLGSCLGFSGLGRIMSTALVGFSALFDHVLYGVSALFDRFLLR